MVSLLPLLLLLPLRLHLPLLLHLKRRKKSSLRLRKRMTRVYLCQKVLFVRDAVVVVFGRIMLLLVAMVLKLSAVTILEPLFSMKVQRVGAVVLVKF
jgi:hypothetical protein